MAFPLDPSGAAASNKVVNEVHAVGTLEQRYIIPDHGAFFVNKATVINDATNQLLEPIIDYMILQLNIDASNETLKETAQIIYVINPSVLKVRLNYQAVGGAYESIHNRVSPLIADFINGKTSNRIFNAVAGELVELSPRDFLSDKRVLNGGNQLYMQLSNIAEAISNNDPSAVQAVYEYLINYTKGVRQEYTDRIKTIRDRLDAAFKSTEIANGQYLFTHEDLNPFVYLNYGKWQNNPNVLYFGGDENQPIGDLFNVSNGAGLYGMRTMAYRRDDNGPGVNYQLTPNRNVINEGETVTFTLTAPGLGAGTRIPFVLAGVRSTDVVGGLLSGAFILNASGVGTFSVTMTEDNETDGDTNLILRLTQSPDIFATVQVKDTSQRVTFNTFFSSDAAGTRVVQSADEGSTVYLQIRTGGLTTDRNFFLLYDGSTINNSDVETRPTTVTVSNNRATVPYKFINDYVTEGNETLIANVCTTQNIATMVSRSVLQVNDTSKTPTITTQFTATSGSNEAATSVNEGQQTFLRIRTTNMPDGAVVQLTYGGTASTDDFTNQLPNSVSLLNNEVTVMYQTKADGKTEGDETFIVTATLVNAPTVKTNATITIRDTSVGYALDSVFYSNSADGTQPITSATIPSNVYICVRTKGFANGDSVHVDFGTSDASVRNLLTATTGLIRLNNNYGSLLITLDDSRGSYTAVGQLRAKISTYTSSTIGDQLGTAPNFAVNPRAIPTARVTALDTSGNPVTQIGEGQTLRIRIDTTNIPNGAGALPVRHSGTATQVDFNTVFPTSVVINNGTATLEYSIKADGLLEGTETFIVSVDLPYGGGTSSVQVNILDTSLPVANLRWTSDVSGNNAITQTNEGTTAYLQIRTSGFVDGTILQLRYSGNVNDADVTGGRPATVAIVSGAAVIPFAFANDYASEGNETLTVGLAYQGTALSGSASLIVADTSVPGPIEIKWSRSADPKAAVGNIVFSEGESAYLHIRAMNLPVGTELQMSYSGTAAAADFVNGLPTVIPTQGEWTTRKYDILEDYTEEPGANELLYATATYRARSVATASPMAIMDTSKYLFVKDGASKSMQIMPGETYYVIVMGAGGGGGRALASSTKNGAEGDGTIGGMSMAQVNSLDGANSYRVTAYGGGGGKGVPIHTIDPFGTLMHDQYRAAPGGWLADSVIGTGQSFLAPNPVFRYNGMSGGTTKGSSINFGALNGNWDHGHSCPGIVSIPWNSTLPLSVLSLFWNGYGDGGVGGLGMGQNNTCSGTGGSAGGVWAGAFTNPTSQPLNLTLMTGRPGQAYIPSTPIGTRGSDGGPGMAVAFKIGSHTYNPAGNGLTSIAASTVASGQAINWDKLNKIIVPVGKRLRLTFQSGAATEPSGDWACQDMIAVREYGGVTFNTANNDNMSFVRANRNRYGNYSVESYDSQNCFKNGFRHISIRTGWRGARADDPTEFREYYRGLGLGAGSPIDPRRYGFSGDGQMVGLPNSQLLTQNDETWRGTLSSNTRADGWPRFHVIFDNRTTSRMVLVPFSLISGNVQYTGRIYYDIEDI